MIKFYHTFFLILFFASQSIGQNNNHTKKKITKIVQTCEFRHGVKTLKNDTLYNKYPWFVPKSYKLQYAGNLGIGAIGFTYDLSNTYDLSFMLGYFKEGIESGEVVTITLKNNFKITKFKLFDDYSFIPVAGFNIIWGHTHNTFKALPAHYPDKYYFQNEVHFAPYVGYIISKDLKNKHLSQVSFYTEIGSLDNYILECIRTKYIKINDVINVSFGINIKLRDYHLL